MPLGCASIGIQDPSLDLEITPLPLQRGKPALAKVNAPFSAAKVTGKVLVAGSPELVFRKDVEEKVWYFYGTIPFSPWVKPGEYKVRLTVESLHEKPHYTEMKVRLQ